MIFTLISDLNKTIAGDYGVLLDAGISRRGLFIINKDAVLRHATINHVDLCRNINDVLRLLGAIDYTEEHGEVCPGNWQKREKAMKPDADSLKQYMLGTKDNPTHHLCLIFSTSTVPDRISVTKFETITGQDEIKTP